MTFGQTLIIEGLKIIAQATGAFVIAWVAVRWALQRYKSEKMWERQLATFADTLGALGDLIKIYDDYYNDELIKREYSGRHELNRKKSKDKIIELESISSLILPPSTAVALQELNKVLSAGYDSWFHELDSSLARLEITHAKVLAEGKRTLGAVSAIR